MSEIPEYERMADAYSVIINPDEEQQAIIDAVARIRELEERLHARLLAVAALAQQSTDRDAAWERAIQSLAEQGVITIDDPIAAVRERMEAEGGGA